MAKRISDLPEASLPPNPESLVEVATPNNNSPTGYVSEHIPLSSIGGGITNRFFFSGEVALDETGYWDFQLVTTEQLRSLYGENFSEIGTATLNVSISVRSIDGGSTEYGSSFSTVIYDPYSYSYIHYGATGGVASTGYVSLPVYPENGADNGIPPVINRIFNDDGAVSVGTIIAIAGWRTLPTNIAYSGYVDINVQELQPGV